jgi:hypothetical protein
MAVGAAGGWHDHPSALGFNQIADEVVREFVARRFGHRDLVPRTTDNNLGSGLLAPLHLLSPTIEL